MNHLRIILALLSLLLSTAIVHGQVDSCAADINGDGIVAGDDLASVLGSWGPCSGCAADIVADQFVDGVDLAFILSRWGVTCAPTVSGVSPDVGYYTGGTTVTISGTRLRSPVSVTFGGVPATVMSSTANSIMVVTPVGTQGPASVAVTTAGGSALAPSHFIYGPWVTSIAPSSGPQLGGTYITTSGHLLNGASSVTIGGVPCTNVVSVNTTTVTAVTPAGTEGAKAVSVTTPGGTANLTNGFTYTTVWYTVLEQNPNPAIVTSVTLRNAITATGYPWRVSDNETGIEMLLVPPGTFDMGCSPSNQYSCASFVSGEFPVHSVTLTNAFYIGRYEVTQAQWQARMGSNPSYWQAVPENGYTADTNRPVEMVSWSMIAGMGGFLTGTGLRLPTEAEWEYAYRAGTTTAFHGSTGYLSGTNDDSLVGSIAWFSGNNFPSGTPTFGTKAVGQKLANGFGLHDMSGNVWELVNDWHSPLYYSISPSSNPLGPASGTSRVMRGGDCANSTTGTQRSSFRGIADPNAPIAYIGFRVTRNP
jgi:formylglycine-generating enzyme required for sulfatase activity